MENITGITLGIAIFALVEALVASYKASKAETKAIELYQISCDNVQRRTLSLEYEANKMSTKHDLEALEERIRALEFVHGSKEEK